MMYPSDNAKSWIKGIASRYNIQHEMTELSQNFANIVIKIRDPKSMGLPFIVYFDEYDNPSAFFLENFEPNLINIAEGYTSDDILKSASAVLSGSFELKRTRFRKSMLICFNTSRGRSCMSPKIKHEFNARPYQRIGY